jgi:hypothetical protein
MWLLLTWEPCHMPCQLRIIKFFSFYFQLKINFHFQKNIFFLSLYTHSFPARLNLAKTINLFSFFSFSKRQKNSSTLPNIEYKTSLLLSSFIHSLFSHSVTTVLILSDQQSDNLIIPPNSLNLSHNHNITMTSDPNTWVWSEQIHICLLSCLKTPRYAQRGWLNHFQGHITF